MRVAVYSAHGFERPYLTKANTAGHELVFIESRLTLQTLPLAAGCQAVSLFVSDEGSRAILQGLHNLGIKYCSLRSAGFNHIDLRCAAELGISVAHVPEYSPYAVAEHTVALILALNRKLIRAHARVRDLNFSLDGLTGFDLHGKTAGIIGAGKIGSVVASILHGFGCRLLAFDTKPQPALTEKLGVEFVSIAELCKQSDIITLHAPLNEHTRYLINAERLALMKTGVMLINTSRGGLLKTVDVIDALKSGRVGYLGLDVYEEEAGLFFEDHSEDILHDDLIARLMTFNNVLITSHQAFLTDTALTNIAETSIGHLDSWAGGRKAAHEL